MYNRLLFLILFLLIVSNQVFAQKPKANRRGSSIIDDTTKQIYGAGTSRFTSEEDVILNRKSSYPTDTTLDDFHRFNFVERSNFKLMDLGSMGTATKPVFYIPPSTIGTRFGIDVFDPFNYSPDKVKYYDTKSPLAKLYYVQGGRGQGMLEVVLSRNVNPRWNLSLSFRRLTADKRFGTFNAFSGSQSIGNKNVTEWALVAATRYFNKDSSYQILAHYSHLNHFVNEQGGIRGIGPNSSLDSIFKDLKTYSAKLENGNARDYRNNWHVYHQYVIANGFQLFHVFEKEHRTYNFSITKSISDTAFFNTYLSPNTFITDSAANEVKFNRYENKVGIKGKFQDFDYILYGKNRIYTYRNDLFGLKQTGINNFVGITLDYQFSNRANLHAEAEYMLFKDYRIEATYVNRFLTLKYQRFVYSPTLVQQQFPAHQFKYNDRFPPHIINFQPPSITSISTSVPGLRYGSSNNDFNVSFSDNLYAGINYQLKNILLNPFAEVHNLKNQIIYNQKALPEQINKSSQLLMLGFHFSFPLGKFIFDNETIVSTITGADVLMVPNLFSTGKFYYQNILFKGATELQIGIDVNYKSAYYSNAYMPISGQYFLQDNFKTNGFPVVDLFANARLKNVRLFAKFSQINQGFPAGGYYPAPYYPGLQRTFSFGASWAFYD